MASTIPCRRSTSSEHNSAKAKHGLPYMHLVMVLPSPTTDVPSILYQTSAINLPYSNMALSYSTTDLPPLPQICFLDHNSAKLCMACHTCTWRWFCFTLPRICLPLPWIYPVWFCHTLLLLPEPAKVYNHLCRYSETHLLHALQLILRSIYFNLNVFLNKQLQVQLCTGLIMNLMVATEIVLLYSFLQVVYKIGHQWT